MKDIAKKYRDAVEKLEKDLSLNKSTKDNIKRCLAIYVNGEILRAFYNHVQQPGVIVSADMIAFLYLHVQMSGAANECLSRSFTNTHKELSDVLFDQTTDGKGAPRLLRFAGAHSDSLALLLSSYTPRLLQDYIDIIEDILPVLEKVILSHVPSLAEELHRLVKVDFFPMQPVDFSSQKFTVASQNANTGLVLESLKAIDIIAPILKQHVEFYKSDSGQALVIMARQIFENNIHELQNYNDIYESLKTWAQDNNASLAELRQYRNKSAHAFVMWEIQCNPPKLRFNSLRLVVAMKEVLLEQLDEISPGHYARYLNKPTLKNIVREADDALEVDLEESKRPPLDRNKSRKKKLVSTEEFDEGEFPDANTDNCICVSDYVFKLVQFTGHGTTVERMQLLELILNLLAVARSQPQLQEYLVNNINVQLSSEKIFKQKRSASCGFIGTPYSIVFRASTGESTTFAIELEDKKYPKGIKKFELNFVGALFYLLLVEKKAFSIKKNLDLFIRVLQTAFDLGASPNVNIQTLRGKADALSLVVCEGLPEELVTFLIENGVNINNAVDDKMCISALNHAARFRPNLVMQLLQAGCNPTDIVYDPYTDSPCTSTIFYDIYATPEADVNLRMKSLKILFPYVYQIYGEEALLINMRAPMKFANGIEVTVGIMTQKMQSEKDPSIQCIWLHQKVGTVLSNPRFNLYKLILNDELEIMVQEIDRLGSPKEILAAMGATNGAEETHNSKKWTAVDFAVDLGLMPLALYLGRIRAFCLAPSVMACSDIANYFTTMEACLYNILNANFTCKYNHESHVFNIIADYWGGGVERQSVAHYCL